MFAKFLIFVLLGTSFVLATPYATEEEFAVQDRDVLRSSWTDKLGDWWNGAKDKFQEYFETGKKSFEEAVEEIKTGSSKIIVIGKDTWANLKRIYDELQQKAKKEYDEQKHIWDEKVEEAKKQGKQYYEEMKEKAAEALEQERQKWITQLKDWQAKVEQAFEEAEKNENNVY